MTNIAILASGSGSNAENIIQYFEGHQNIKVSLIITNKKDAYVRTRAERLKTDCFYFTKEELNNSSFILEFLRSKQIDSIVLAGYLLLIPEFLIEAFPNKIINIHPALLPKYGGKGMYGDNVHKAVVENGEKESGITIHYVNSQYDEGEIIFQARCEVEEKDQASDVADKIHILEMEHFPKVIEELINNR